MIFITILISVAYIVLITSFIIGFNRVDSFNYNNTPPKNTFSILIPFRNEAHNLPDLVTSIYQLNYPSNLFEVLLIDDKSSDNYLEAINSFAAKDSSLSIRILRSAEISNSPKKKAINLGIENATFNWIVTTDADCVVPQNWLQLFNQQIEEKCPLFISAPVKFKEQNSFLFHFQNLNFISLIGSSIGSFGIGKPILCNGANLCYNKEAFFKVNGYNGNLEIASGDDIFLLEKMSKSFPEKVTYLKSTKAVVQTKSEQNFTSFFNQQLRWASKSTAYKNKFSKFVGITVLTLNTTLIVFLISSFFNHLFWKFLIAIFIQKILLDFLLIYKTAKFLASKQSLKYYIITSILHPFFIVFVGIRSLFKNYKWKDREFKK